MDLVNIDPALVTPLDKVVTINLYCCSEIASSKDRFSHNRPFSMDSFTTSMDGPYDRVCFMSIHVPEQDKVIIPFIQHIPIQEELGKEISQSLLISDGHILGILLFL